MENVTETKQTEYINREISWLQFNRRVLQEAEDESTPLLERCKFLSIVSTNLDEFVSVRAAGIIDKIRAGNNKADYTGYTPQQLLQVAANNITELVADQYRAYERIRRLLEKEGFVFTTCSELTSVQKKEMEVYFTGKIFPVLTPLAIDKSRPFPLIRTKSVYLAVLLQHTAKGRDEKTHVAFVELPANLSRFIEVTPQINNQRQFLLLEDLIKEHIQMLFSMYAPVDCHTFRLTRNADLALDEESADDLLDEMERVLRKRKWGAPVRLEIERGFAPSVLELLMKELEIDHHILIESEGPIDLSYYMAFSNGIKGYEHLKYPRFEPVYPGEFDKTDDIFSVLQERDVLVFHPYESFEAVKDFLEQAAEDPLVLAVKMTLYRVNGQSRIIESLRRAAELGKQVTVIVEIKARFDEARNIVWAKKLEKAGCHVVYGLAGLKIHSKMTLVVRREDDALRRYIHIGTGNYNEVTARGFTDIGMFTSNPEIGEDVSNLFNQITGFSVPGYWHSLSVAPTHLKQSLHERIVRESENASLGKPARIIAKLNSLSNKEMIDGLYAASRAGVHIDLIVRGICCLRPGIPGLSENITVRSIVDRFLEHSRIYYFENGGDPEIWISSADWMTRNLNHRIELMYLVQNEGLKSILIHLLSLLLKDNVKARQLLPDGSYIMAENELPPCRSQFEAKDIFPLKLQMFERERNQPGHALPSEPYHNESVIYH